MLAPRWFSQITESISQPTPSCKEITANFAQMINLIRDHFGHSCRSKVVFRTIRKVWWKVGRRWGQSHFWPTFRPTCRIILWEARFWPIVWVTLEFLWFFAHLQANRIARLVTASIRKGQMFTKSFAHKIVVPLPLKDYTLTLRHFPSFEPFSGRGGLKPVFCGQVFINICAFLLQAVCKRWSTM